jgi:protein TonB
VSELADQLSSPTASLRAEAARELAGARRLPSAVWEALGRLALDDPDRVVRLAAARTQHLLVIQGVRGGVAETYDEDPRPLEMERPEYPGAAGRKGIAGTVRVLILIDERGDVEEAEIIESIPELDDAALGCVRDWKFEPARKGGQPTPAYVVAPIAFTVTESLYR